MPSKRITIFGEAITFQLSDDGVCTHNKQGQSVLSELRGESGRAFELADLLADAVTARACPFWELSRVGRQSVRLLSGGSVSDSGNVVFWNLISLLPHDLFMRSGRSFASMRRDRLRSKVWGDVLDVFKFAASSDDSPERDASLSLLLQWKMKELRAEAERMLDAGTLPPCASACLDGSHAIGESWRVYMPVLDAVAVALAKIRASQDDSSSAEVLPADTGRAYRALSLAADPYHDYGLAKVANHLMATVADVSCVAEAYLLLEPSLEVAYGEFPEVGNTEIVGTVTTIRSGANNCFGWGENVYLLADNGYLVSVQGTIAQWDSECRRVGARIRVPVSSTVRSRSVPSFGYALNPATPTFIEGRTTPKAVREAA